MQALQTYRAALNISGNWTEENDVKRHNAPALSSSSSSSSSLRGILSSDLVIQMWNGLKKNSTLL